MKNNLLNIKFAFEPEKNKNRPGNRTLAASRSCSCEHLQKLFYSLVQIRAFYRNSKIDIGGCLIDVHYFKTISKSGRIEQLFKYPEKYTSNDYIVGARYDGDTIENSKHVITYFLPYKTIEHAIDCIRKAHRFVRDKLDGNAQPNNFNIPLNNAAYEGYDICKTALRAVVVDCSVIDRIDIPSASPETLEKDSIVNFYRTYLDISELIDKLLLSGRPDSPQKVGELTYLVSKDTYKVIHDSAPFLICMAVSDISEISLNQNEIISPDTPEIPKPGNEPTIGVIDTVYDEKAYFKDWVEYHDERDEYEKMLEKPDVYRHGTEIDSILIDGPALNPDLDDGCGRFRVRHFAVCSDTIPVIKLMRRIEKIVSSNQDIKVWNLSLGNSSEVSLNFMSYDGAILDQLQSKYDIIFVISGTNSFDDDGSIKKVGSPADSLNSLVVNSVRKDKSPCSYSRTGPVLSFFRKPDVSYYGGDKDEKITCYMGTAKDECYGTSIAAPWMSRKLCYLIEIMGLQKEVAKALLINSAIPWNKRERTKEEANLEGYGVVPIRIEDVLECGQSEILFTVYGSIESYASACYAIPVPREKNNKTAYRVKAVLCYFPKCDRLQGVDYTQRDLSLAFGPVIIDGNKTKIMTGNESEFSDEAKDRAERRKWDNTKVAAESIKDKIRPRKLGETGQYGLKITSIERSARATMERINFGLVINLKNINGENRIEEFKRDCLIRGYIVNEISIGNQIEIYNEASQDIRWDE